MGTKDITAHHNECPVPNGILYIIGGAEDKGRPAEQKQESNAIQMEVLKGFVDLLPANGVIELVTSASSSSPEESYKEYKKAFTGLGAAEINHIHHDTRESIKLNDIKERLKTAHAIFFAGGDQLKLTSVYGGTELLKVIKQRYIYDGLVVAGTSAGAMALSTPMIYGGVGMDEMIAGNVKVTTGLEFMRDVCVDTHFVNRGRLVRIAQVIAENPASIGVGIEEDTSIIVKNGCEVEVTGSGVVIIINGNESYGSNITDHMDKVPLTIRGLKVDILSRGEKFTIPQYNPPHQ